MRSAFSAAIVLLALSALTGPNALCAGETPVTPSPSVFVPPNVFVASPSVFVPRVAFPDATSAGHRPAPGIEAALAEGVTFERASNAGTNAVVGSITSANQFCAAIPGGAYNVDCLSERLEAAALALPKTGDYVAARSALLDASRKLHKLARENAAPDLPRVRVSSQGDAPISTARPLTPVAPSAQAAVNAQAQTILDETATVLLRSAETTDQLTDHYSRISAAVDSNKVLLRSA